MTIAPAPEPDEILWENFELDDKPQRKWMAINFTMVAGMLAGKLFHAAGLALLVRRTDWAAQVRSAAKSVRSEEPRARWT